MYKLKIVLSKAEITGILLCLSKMQIARSNFMKLVF
jgi:hypothetical protein